MKLCSPFLNRLRVPCRHGVPRDPFAMLCEDSSRCQSRAEQRNASSLSAILSISCRRLCDPSFGLSCRSHAAVIDLPVRFSLVFLFLCGLGRYLHQHFPCSTDTAQLPRHEPILRLLLRVLKTAMSTSNFFPETRLRYHAFARIKQDESSVDKDVK